MTVLKCLSQEKIKSPPSLCKPARLSLFLFLLLSLTLFYAEEAAELVRRGLLLSAKVVLPSLFPCIVLSELIVASGAITALPRLALAPLRWLFRVSDVGVCAILLGLLCGTPVGLVCATAALRRGELTKREATLVTVACSPSPAFLIGAVGTVLWGDRLLGLLLYLSTVGVAILTEALAARVLLLPKPQSKRSHPTVALNQTVGFASLFCRSVAAALQSSLGICTYVVLFSVITGLLLQPLQRLSLPPFAVSLLSCTLELSGGVDAAAKLGNTQSALFLTAFAAGWSGLSVHCQALSTCSDSHLSMRPYLLARLLQGLLTPPLFLGLLSLFY